MDHKQYTFFSGITATSLSISNMGPLLSFQSDIKRDWLRYEPFHHGAPTYAICVLKHYYRCIMIGVDWPVDQAKERHHTEYHLSNKSWCCSPGLFQCSQHGIPLTFFFELANLETQ